MFSYRLSIVHFWSLIFLYIWAGPHHLLYTALPDWAQSLGMVFSVMLIAPSWGGMVNGLLTLRGAWDRVREDPVLKFLVVGITAYGMATFEGPMLSLKNVNALTHYTDWIIGHVHVGALAGTAAWRSRCSTTSCRASTARSCTRCGSPTCTSGWRRSASCSTRFRCTSPASRRA